MSPLDKETPAVEALWTVSDVASYLKVSRAWVYDRAARGELPCVHLGGLRRFRPSAVVAWIGERTSTGPAQLRKGKG